MQIVNGATVYYLSAVAVAVGFRMNLFNIGVDGQYRVAAFAGALFAGQAWFPGPAQRPADPRRRDGRRRHLGRHRGLPQGQARHLRGDQHDHAQRDRHRRRAVAAAQGGRQAAGQQHDLDRSRSPSRRASEGSRSSPGATNKVYTLLILAVVVGFAYWFFIGKTRFGFDLRATGQLRDRRRRQRRQGAPDGRLDARHLRRPRRASSACRCSSARTTATARPSRPGSASPASASPCSVATTPSASPSPRCCGPSSTCSPTPCRSGPGVASEVVFIIQGVILFAVVIAYELDPPRRRAARAAARREGAGRHRDPMPRPWKERRHERLRTQRGHRGRAREHPDAQARPAA